MARGIVIIGRVEASKVSTLIIVIVQREVQPQLRTAFLTYKAERIFVQINIICRATAALIRDYAHLTPSAGTWKK